MAKKKVKKEKNVEKVTISTGELLIGICENSQQISELTVRIDRIVAALTTAKPITKDM